MPKVSSIPTYASDGRRIRSYSLPAIERLLSMSKVVVRRNRKGKIVSASFRPHDGASPLRGTCNMGQRYSMLVRVGDYRLWQHRRLNPPQDTDAEQFLQLFSLPSPSHDFQPSHNKP